MDAFEIPPLQIDPRTLPPPLLTSEPGSFAHNTLKVRIPRIIEETIQENSFPVEINRALQDLRAEIMIGTLRGLREEAPDKVFWDRASRDYVGRSWLDLPWYWAEAFFYRRVLEATRYFQSGEWRAFDPYTAKKQKELAPDAAPRTVDEILRALPADPRARFEALFHSALWGNRTDLSYNVAAQIGNASRLEDERSNLLVDDTAHVWEFLRARPRRRIAIIADNAGTELLNDLALIEFLLNEVDHEGRPYASQIVLHLKAQPFFVSDAMPSDVEAGLSALMRGAEHARALAERIREHLVQARLQLRTHWFYTTCLLYIQLPQDLRAELAAMDFVVLKGDANYRRLLGDAHWPPTTPLDRAAAYFPAPFVALRTLKAELIVGLRAGEAESLSDQDPQWLVNGRRGVIQARF